MKIIELEEIDSTNEYCKRIDNGEDVIVTAMRQSKGKGTKGRSFVSDQGGLYVSIMKHYIDFDSSDTFKIMVGSCVAVCKTLENFKIAPVIRWANDVLADGKKICGTLIENNFIGNKITRSIIGIGLNVNNNLPEELSDIATTMRLLLGKKIDVEVVMKELINNLQKDFTIDDYKYYVNWLGSNVILKTVDGELKAKTLDIDSHGRLVCEIDGKKEYISAAEVSLRL